MPSSVSSFSSISSYSTASSSSTDYPADFSEIRIIYGQLTDLDNDFARIISFVNCTYPVYGMSDAAYSYISSWLKGLRSILSTLGNWLRRVFDQWRNEVDIYAPQNRPWTATVFWLNEHRRKLALSIEKARELMWHPRCDPEISKVGFYSDDDARGKVHISYVGGPLEHSGGNYHQLLQDSNTLQLPFV